MNKRIYILRTISIIIALCVGFLLVEFGLRIYVASIANPSIWNFNMERGISVLKPELDMSYYSEEGNSMVHLKTTKDGYIGEDVLREKGEGVKRIAVLGDSFVQALQVDYDKNFTALLEEKLNTRDSTYTWEMLNFGTGGQGTSEQIIKYEYVVKGYDPDIVLLVLYEGNDYSDNENFHTSYPELVPSFEKGEYKIPVEDSTHTEEITVSERSFLKKILLSFKTIDILHRAARQNEKISALLVKVGVFKDLSVVDRTLGDILPFLMKEGYGESVDFSIQSTLIKHLQSQVEADGARFMMILIPSHWQTSNHFRERISKSYEGVDFELPSKILNSQVSAPTHTLYTRFTVEINEEKAPIYILSRGHLTSYGHEVVAEELYTFLMNQNI